MKTQMNSLVSKQHGYVFIVGLCALCIVCALWLGGCAVSPQATTSDSSASSGVPAESGEGSSANPDEAKTVLVQGTITSINEAELLIEAAEDENEFLQGPVRVDVSQIDADTVSSLKAGDTVKIGYTGAVGMSQPPFIFALTLEVIN